MKGGDQFLPGGHVPVLEVVDIAQVVVVLLLLALTALVLVVLILIAQVVDRLLALALADFVLVTPAAAAPVTPFAAARLFLATCHQLALLSLGRLGFLVDVVVEAFLVGIDGFALRR